MDKKVLHTLGNITICALLIITVLCSAINAKTVKEKSLFDQHPGIMDNAHTYKDSRGKITLLDTFPLKACGLKRANMQTLHAQGLVFPFQPRVVITSPENGTVFTQPEMMLKGYATYELGIDNIGYIWEWEKGATGSSWPIDPPQSYYEFEWEFILYEGWNRINVTARGVDDSYGSDEITVYYEKDTEPPVVVIEYPEDGSTFDTPIIEVKGYAEDNVGVTVTGYTHKWKDGEQSISSTVDPPSKHIYIEIEELELRSGWNNITVFAEDAARNRGEDYVNVTYVPGIPGLSFYQIDYIFEDGKIIDSYIGEILIHEVTLTSHFGIPTGYLNVMTPLGWVVQNLLVTSEVVNEGLPYVSCKFHLREGPPFGINVNTLDAYIDFSPTPLPEFYGEFFTSFPVKGTTVYLTGPYFIPSAPPLLEFICFPTINCLQDGHPNIQAAKNQCGPAACANSLQYLENKHPKKIKIPHENKPGLKGDNTLVGQLDETMERVANSRTSGGGVKTPQYIKGKLKYLEKTGLGQCIKVKHQSKWAKKDITVGNLTSKNKGGTEGKVTFDFIFNEVCAGEDVEIKLLWPNGGAHFVEVTGAGWSCGKPYIRHVSDQQQTHQGDPNDKKGCDKTQFDWVEDDGKGGVKVVKGSSPVGTIIESVISQSPNDPPKKPDKPDGPTKVKRGEPQTYTTNPATDLDGDKIQKYEWDFNGDGKVNKVTDKPSATFTWDKKGTYEIRVRARDEYGAVSEWSDPLSVNVPKSSYPLRSSLLYRLIHSLPLIRIKL
jgi:hypothetical protein